jgi:hypothetical protein
MGIADATRKLSPKSVVTWRKDFLEADRRFELFHFSRLSVNDSCHLRERRSRKCHALTLRASTIGVVFRGIRVAKGDCQPPFSKMTTMNWKQFSSIGI